MLRAAAGVLVLFALTGCMGGLHFDKPGVAPGAGQDDLTACEIEAAQQVPVSTRVETNLDGSLRTSDANTTLRWRAVIMCMEAKGYRLRGKSYPVSQS